MTNHVHLIAKAEGNFTLSEILRDFKKYTSKAIFKAISENKFESRREMLINHYSTPDGIRVWQPDSYPIELWSNEVITQKLNYIHQNPVEEGLVFRAEDYVYSSAIDYAGEKGMLDIVVIE
jgi:REP element-mobilizing transposase RayT